MAREDRCPSIGELGSLLGKTKSQASFVYKLCEMRSDACEHWDMYSLDLLADAPAPHPPPAVRLPLATSAPASALVMGNLKPHVRLSVGRRGGRALVDTAWTTTYAGSKWFSEIVASAGTYVKDTVISGNQRHRALRKVMTLPRLQLGRSVYLHEPVILDYGISESDYDIVGMSLLLQHPAVCFSWRESLLYLGDLGPCSQGVSPYRARFVGGHVVAVELVAERTEHLVSPGQATVASDALEPRAEGETYFALLDTGIEAMKCLTDFPRVSTFRFGPHDDMTVKCDWNWSNYSLMGMSVLSKFAAFGWELDPLRVYFVPMAADADDE